MDLGTLTWTYRSQFGGFDAIPSPIAKDAFVGVCSAFKYGGAYSDLSDNEIGYVYLNHIFVKSSAYTDANAFKTAMSGVYLVYKLATPTTETADPYTNPQEVGTVETFTDTRDVPIPVGVDETYYEVTEGEVLTVFFPTEV